VIRNVVIHIANEQPILADVYELPTPSDVSLVCTNVRMLDGKKPIFIDNTKSVFVFPYLTLRFIEMLPGSTDGLTNDGAGEHNGVATLPVEETEPEPELELDEDFLRRIREV
jgi:hypothetical protein